MPHQDQGKTSFGPSEPNTSKMKQRCTFELQFCELDGVSSRYDAVRLVVDHRDGKRRYAASEAIKPSFGTASVPSLSFQCGVYPSKVRLCVVCARSAFCTECMQSG